MSTLDDVRRLASDALDFGLDAVRVGYPPTPFCLIEDERGIEHRWLFAETPERALALARAAIRGRSDSVLRFALGRYDVLEEPDGRSEPALIVEAADASLQTALMMARTYRPFEGVGRPLHSDARPRVLGDAENPLRGAEPQQDPPSWPDLAVMALCPDCGRKNRVGLSRLLAGRPKCGVCKKSLARPR